MPSPVILERYSFDKDTVGFQTVHSKAARRAHLADSLHPSQRASDSSLLLNCSVAEMSELSSAVPSSASCRGYAQFSRERGSRYYCLSGQTATLTCSSATAAICRTGFVDSAKVGDPHHVSLAIRRALTHVQHLTLLFSLSAMLAQPP